MVKMMTHTEAQSFEISKLKSFLEKPSNPPGVTGICNQSKSRAQRQHSLKLGLKLKYLNSD